jgi:hypothetical protein
MVFHATKLSYHCPECRGAPSQLLITRAPARHASTARGIRQFDIPDVLVAAGILVRKMSQPQHYFPWVFRQLSG